MESANETEQRAAEWLTRRDSGTWRQADQDALDRWLGESTGNLVAFVRLESAWARADRFNALGAGFPRGKIPTPEEFKRSPFFAAERGALAADGNWRSSMPESGTDKAATPRLRMHKVAGALCAALALALVVSVAWVYWPATPDYKTPIGGTVSVPMADGSEVTLNTDSAIRVALTESEREVRLDHGEAFFEVAHDPSRPFVVRAGNKRVIAVGTKFSVRRIGDDIRVFVAEGKVRLEEGESGSLQRPPEQAGLNQTSGQSAAMPFGSTPQEAGDIFLAAGGVARTDGDGILVQEKSLAEVEESLSWRTGYIIFHESTLADAANEFNRYNVQKILVDDPGIVGIKLSGKFRTTDFEGFVRLIEAGFSLHVRQSGSRIVLTRN